MGRKSVGRGNGNGFFSYRHGQPGRTKTAEFLRKRTKKWKRFGGRKAGNREGVSHWKEKKKKEHLNLKKGCWSNANIVRTNLITGRRKKKKWCDWKTRCFMRNYWERENP